MEAFKQQCEALKRKTLEKNQSSIVDGLINIEKYAGTSPKILWVFKEPNSPEGGGWNFQEYLSKKHIESKKEKRGDVTKYRFFVRVLSVSYGVINGLSESDGLPPIGEERVYGIGEHIAYMNIKKIGGGASANDDVIAKEYEKNKELLVEQISVYNPDVIIFGNTLRYFNISDLQSIGWNYKNCEAKNKSKLSQWYFMPNGKLVINAKHPSYWAIKDKYYYDDVIGAVSEWKLRSNN